MHGSGEPSVYNVLLCRWWQLHAQQRLQTQPCRHLILVCGGSWSWVTWLQKKPKTVVRQARVRIMRAGIVLVPC